MSSQLGKERGYDSGMKSMLNKLIGADLKGEITPKDIYLAKNALKVTTDENGDFVRTDSEERFTKALSGLITKLGRNGNKGEAFHKPNNIYSTEQIAFTLDLEEEEVPVFLKKYNIDFFKVSSPDKYLFDREAFEKWTAEQTEKPKTQE